MSRSAGEQRLLVIGIGNPDRADDGIGPRVAARLARVEGARVILRSGDALGLLDDWADADAVILIDAAAPLSQPGAIHRIDALSSSLPPSPPRSSTHLLAIAEAIELARALDRLPARMIVYAIEGMNFAPGAPMTAQVAAAAEQAAERIAEELHGMRSARAV